MENLRKILGRVMSSGRLGKEHVNMRGVDKGTVFFLTAESEGLVILGGPPRGGLLNL